MAVTFSLNLHVTVSPRGVSVASNWMDEQRERKDRERAAADRALEAAVYNNRLLDARLPQWFRELKVELTAGVRTACDNYSMDFDFDIGIREMGAGSLTFTKKRHPSSRLEVDLNAAARSLTCTYRHLDGTQQDVSYDLAVDVQGRVYLSRFDGDVLNMVQTVLEPFVETF